jgi:predicted transcriptional regulator
VRGDCGLHDLHFLWKTEYMSARDIIEQIKALPPDQRAEVTKFVVESDDSWIPEEFKQGMADIAAGRVVDLDTALNEPYPAGR